MRAAENLIFKVKFSNRIFAAPRKIKIKNLTFKVKFCSSFSQLLKSEIAAPEGRKNMRPRSSIAAPYALKI